MRPAARSLFVFGIYAVLAGLGLTFTPTLLIFGVIDVLGAVWTGVALRGTQATVGASAIR